MSARSFVIQLQAGVGQAILPDHRKMVPGVQYVVDAETFNKISLGARQNVISVVNVNLDTTGTGAASVSGTYVPAQVAAGINNQLSPLTLLTTVSPSPTTFSVAGFAAQGYSAGGEAGTNTGIQFAQDTLSGNATNVSLTGPDGARYVLGYNGTASTISGGWATVWQDENNRYISTASGIPLLVKQDGLGTAYTVSADTTLTGTNGTVTTVGTKAGEFAGITLVNIPAGNFGFIQIEGTCPSAVVASGTAVGATIAVSPSSNNGTLAVPATTTTSVSNGVVTGSALANNVVGTVLTAPASGTNGQFFAAIDLRSRRVKKPYNRFLNKN
jgi:hypothetical protein